ncbi:hypothetical protein AFCA_012370 [Aspergillus flavus]|nr:hypothetical protein AFCA_012370 [Aspergillus flavus]
MTRSILHTLADHAQEVEKIIHVRFSNFVDTMPKGTRHVTLLYHQKSSSPTTSNSPTPPPSISQWQTQSSPQALDGQAYLEEAHWILDEMISNGNKVAEVRKAELVHLQTLFEELTARVKSQGLQPLTLTSPTGAEAVPQTQIVEEDGEGETVTDIGVWDLPIPGDSLTSHGADMQMSSVELLNNIGISSSDFLYIVDQIGNPDVSYSILDLGRAGGEME